MDKLDLHFPTAG